MALVAGRDVAELVARNDQRCDQLPQAGFERGDASRREPAAHELAQAGMGGRILEQHELLARIVRSQGGGAIAASIDGTDAGRQVAQQSYHIVVARQAPQPER